jgi:hypothetical protein
MTSCQYKQSTEQYALFKNKVDQFKDFSQKLILTVLSNLFRTLQTRCIKGRLTSWIHFSFLFLKCYLPEITEFCSELILLKKIYNFRRKLFVVNQSSQSQVFLPNVLPTEFYLLLIKTSQTM